jgi:translation initiation factor eIF-2B subunit epsilon
VLKVLLPLVNVPMINYTLAWLESAGVEEVIVFCCAHSKQVIDYLESSEWFSHPNFSVTMIVSHNSNGVGDALRAINGRNVVCPCLNFLSYISVFMRSWNFLRSIQF